MWFELVDADWFEIDGMDGSVENVIDHYEKININPDFYVKIHEFRNVKFEKMFADLFSKHEHNLRFFLYETNEVIFQIFLKNNVRIFYSDDVREFLFNLKMICGLTINSHPQILKLADYVKYDWWFFNRCFNKN